MSFTSHTLFFSRVSISSQHVSHVFGVGELPAINVLYVLYGLVRCTGRLHFVQIDPTVLCTSHPPKCAISAFQNDLHESETNCTVYVLLTGDVL